MPEGKNPKWPLLAMLCGLIVAIVGAGYLAAWLGGAMATYRGPATITMKTNAALGLTLSGLALLLVVPGQDRRVQRLAARLCAAVVLVLGGITFAQNVAGWDFGIDQLLAQEPPGAMGTPAPNRMGTPASLSFVLASLAILLLCHRSERGAWWAQMLALVVCLIALLGVLGYLYRAQAVYGAAWLTPIAWPMALALLVLGIGLLCVRPTTGWMAQVTAQDVGGTVIRWLLVPAVLVPVLLGWLHLLGERLGYYASPMGASLLILMFVVGFGFLIYQVGRRLSRLAGREQAAQAALRESEERFRSFMSHTPLASWVVDESGQFRYTNPSYYRLFRTNHSDLVGRAVTEIYPHAPIEEQLRNNRIVLEEQRVLATEESGTRPDGSAGQFLVVRFPMLTTEGERLVGGMALDITDRKHAEEALRQSRQELQETNQTLERRVAERTAEAERRAEQLRQLAGQLAHAEQRERKRVAQILHDHLQQLLVGGKLQTGMLRQQVMRDPQAVEICRQLDDLLDQSLEATRSLTAELSPSVLYTGRLSDALHWLARWMLDKYGLTVQVEAAPEADPQGEDLRVLLFTASRELLFNTVKHAKVREAILRLDRPAADQVRLVVADKGVGFDSSRCCQPKGLGGFGLLSIRERLELLGGQMSVVSQAGHGTTVTLEAPLASQDGQQATGEVAEAAEVVEEAQNEKIRVLLADDHAVVRDGLTRLLEAQPDMQVVGQAWDGLHAVQMALQLRPDVVIMDINMPGVPGTVATSRIREALPDVRIIGLSMFAGQEVADRMTAAGAVRYLGKSDPPDELLAAIRAVASD